MDCIFDRNPRVVAAIFAATPHRGSKLAESWIGHVAASLIRLPLDLQSDIVNVVSENPDAATPTAKAFHREMNFSSVRTLSPRDPVLQAMARSPDRGTVSQHHRTTQRRPDRNEQRRRRSIYKRASRWRRERVRGAQRTQRLRKS